MRFVVTNLLLNPAHSDEDLKIKIAKEIRQEPATFSYHLLKRSIDWSILSIRWWWRPPHFISGRNVIAYKEPEEVRIPKSSFSDRPSSWALAPRGCSPVLCWLGAVPSRSFWSGGNRLKNARKTFKNLKKEGILDPESNICYGEGGAGTFSDGKLNTGVNDVRSKFILDEFVKHGAKSDILWDATPHIGSDYLQNVVKSFREEILSLGGDILFNCRFLSLILVTGSHVEGVHYLDEAGNEKTLASKEVLLGLGHSPLETMEALEKNGLFMEPKDFSIGVRIEHLQAAIDEAAITIPLPRLKELPPSSYKSVVHLSSGRSVYSFCMCPGGYVVNSSSELESVLTNGMSNNPEATETETPPSW
jgi:uncharacterized FAD-dependent dehydrogenase